MRYSRTCSNCGQSFTVSVGDLQPLSRAEQLLCEKEGLDWARMTKVTCSACGTAALINEASLQPTVAGEQCDPTLTALAARVRSIAAGAFAEPGPLYDANRRMIIEAWLENLARNLDEAALVAHSGRDRNGTAMSRAQVAGAVARMAGEMRQNLKRVEEVCGASVRSRVATVLDEAEAHTRSWQQAQVGSKVSVPIDPTKHLSWPKRCVCCFDTNADRQSDLLSRGFAKLQGPSGQNIEIPYCKACDGHVGRRDVGTSLLGCGSVPLLIILVAFLTNTLRADPEKVAGSAALFGLLVIAGIILRSLKPRARPDCASSGQAVRWRETRGKTWLDFENARYGQAFIAENNLQAQLATATSASAAAGDRAIAIAAFVREPLKSLVIDTSNAARAGVFKRSRALAEVAAKHRLALQDVQALAKHLQREEKLFRTIHKSVQAIRDGQVPPSSKDVVRIAEAALLAMVDEAVARCTELGSHHEEYRLKAQGQAKMTADTLNEHPIASGQLMLTLNHIYYSIADVFDNRTAMFALFDRLYAKAGVAAAPVVPAPELPNA